MTYDEVHVLLRKLRFQFDGENAAALQEAEQLDLPRPEPRSFYDYAAHQHKWRYVLTAHGIGREQLDR